MANKDILQYLRETPHNTNVNVVKGMIGNNDGGSIEMTTVFDEDVVLIYSSGQFSPPQGNYFGNFTTEITRGFLKITYEDIISIGIIDPMSSSGWNNSTISVRYNTTDHELLSSVILSDSHDSNYDFYFEVWGKEDSDTSREEIRTYCQTPHHLKIEYIGV